MNNKRELNNQKTKCFNKLPLACDNAGITWDQVHLPHNVLFDNGHSMFARASELRGLFHRRFSMASNFAAVELTAS